ncbi:MAG: tRNA (adenosine(37)-N6)-threonylcarbamoyltransferase complex dimerization subunit type 1 TsaB [Hyphomicrobium sp. 32-62-53]|nr:MAG: tRNA (adenosine(37)-N6)-threonylcarbamoyltransferase complex dimerization subunit type 1 TsaB [Hyphomicrobium sp. 12-62-95]OYY01012.1 MAG: tRNA (adenosine(37)-N6)-threonylcarbamoyltransferase complex dimerization subunit type 1 TsaB [Hyphomicrobium sp. 32-62-53]
MNVLGIDTCFPALSVAVGREIGTPGARVTASTEPMATGHAERLLPLIAGLLAQSGLAITDIDRLAVTIGPGSFTGTRIGIAAARALKLASDTPIVTFTSLEAIALSPSIAPAPSEDDLVIAIDAHRSEAYAQAFDAATREPIGPPRIVAMTDLASLSRGQPVFAVGTAAQAAVAAITAAGGRARAQPGMMFPDMAAAVLRAATRTPETAAVEPLYLRPPDAKPQDGKSLARASA